MTLRTWAAEPDIHLTLYSVFKTGKGKELKQWGFRAEMTLALKALSLCIVATSSRTVSFVYSNRKHDK